LTKSFPWITLLLPKHSSLKRGFQAGYLAGYQAGYQPTYQAGYQTCYQAGFEA